MTYFPSTTVTQNAVISTNNSSTTNIPAGETFTGEAESTLGVNAIQVNITTDQNCIVYLDQSIDGTNWDITDSLKYYYIDGGNSWTFQATAAYARVRVNNLSSVAATTYFRLQTVLCPIVDCLPRALNANGSLKVGIADILDDNIFSKIKSTPMGEIRTAEHTRLVGSVFVGTTFDTNFWTKTIQTGTGDAIESNGQLTLATGETTNSSIIVNSSRTARYVGSYSQYYRSVIRIPPIAIVTGACTKRWGAFTSSNGFFFEHNGTSLSIVCRKTSSDTNKISSGDFNGQLGNTYVLDSNCHTYEIYWTNQSAWFFVDDQFLHKFSGAITPLTDTTSLPIGMECTNSGDNTGNNSIEIRVATINRTGSLQTETISKNIITATTTILKYGSGRFCRLIANDTTNPTAGNVTIYDNISATGTILATVYIPKNPSANPFSLEYNAPFNNGLTVVTAQASNITIVYE
jgi:hypothetical protein